jgi:hypothetical protein
MKRRPVKTISERPYKSCEASTLCILEVNSASISAQTGEILRLRLATETGKLPGLEEK